MSIGYNASVITQAPTQFSDLTKREFKGGIGLNGNPTDAGAAFAAVYAVALANGGSYNDIMPGINFFKTLAEDVRSVVVAGDTQSDIWSGIRAGAGVVAGVLTGTHGRDLLSEAGATVVPDSVADLPAALANL